MGAYGIAQAGLDDEVLYETHEGQIAVIKLNRPARRNAVSAGVTRAISQLVTQTEADDAIRVVVLTSSSPDFFCAGADLTVIAAGQKDDLSTEDGGFAGFVYTQRKKPWIAAVSGPVLAGGFELCLACDMIVATDTARFGLPEVKRGLFAAAGGVYRTGRTLPRNVALELVATGDPISVERAYALGLVNRITTKGALLDEALSLAKSISSNAPMSVAASLAIARAANEMVETELRRQSDAASDLIFSSEDAQEGPRAFLEKRAPEWVGR